MQTNFTSNVDERITMKLLMRTLEEDLSTSEVESVNYLVNSSNHINGIDLL